MKNRTNTRRRGSTLVELSIVMALLAIVSTMIVSFSALVSGYVQRAQADYRFTEEAAAIRTAISDYLATADVEGKTVQFDHIPADGDEHAPAAFLLAPDASPFALSREEQAWTGDGEELAAGHTEFLTYAESVTFKILEGSDDRLLQCTVTGEERSVTFLLSLRCATFKDRSVNEGGAAA